MKLSSYLNSTFASLKYPNYRKWFLGQIISLMGTWVQMTAQGFLLYELTNSMAYLGYMGLAAGLPSLFFMLFGGVLADKFSRRNVLIVTQASLMSLAFVMFILVYLQVIEPWHILLLAALGGIANSFDVPARQAFVFELVNKKDLGNAIALNSMMFNSAAIVGPAAAGILYASLGASWCFLINSVTFLGIIIVLASLKLRSVEKFDSPEKKSLIGEISIGIKYCLQHDLIRTLILLLLVTSGVGMSYSTLLPAWATDILKGDSSTFGYLNSFRGMGSLTGALIVASSNADLLKRLKLLYIGIFIFPLFVFIFSLNKHLYGAYLTISGIGLGLLIIFNTLNSIIQSLVEDRFRGRVMSVYSLAFFGGMPLGAFISGHVAEHIGARLTVLCSAVTCTLAACLFMFRSIKIRERYKIKLKSPVIQTTEECIATEKSQEECGPTMV